jgi:preprotein translocase subunit Sss1
VSAGVILALLVVVFLAFKLIRGVIGFIIKLCLIAAMVFAFMMWQQGGQ